MQLVRLVNHVSGKGCSGEGGGGGEKFYTNTFKRERRLLFSLRFPGIDLKMKSSWFPATRINNDINIHDRLIAFLRPVNRASYIYTSRALPPE